MFNPVEEIYFWSGIFRDHAEFIITALPAKEAAVIATAQNFKNSFSILRSEAEKSLKCTSANAGILIRQMVQLLLNFVEFKRLILRRMLECSIEINITPTFVNHMINEALEFYRTLCLITSGVCINPTIESISLHKIWLPDASGHAAILGADFDPVETQFIKEAQEFKKAFEELYIKADELGKMLERACLSDGALMYLNKQVEEKIRDFICYLEKVKRLREECKILGDFKPLVPDHMIREEKYYLYRVERLKVC